MSIINVENTNLLEFETIQAIVHQSNCHCVMGSGVARSIREKYPELYEADLKTIKGDREKLGSFSWAKLSDGKVGYNMYSQYNYGRDKRYTSYDAMDTALRKIERHMVEQGIKKAGCPKNMGCALGGGSWNIVRAIIGDIFDSSEVELFICEYNPK